jgi:hypothetical protein
VAVQLAEVRCTTNFMCWTTFCCTREGVQGGGGGGGGSAHWWQRMAVDLG